jgi:hypothetical protein
MDKGEHSLRTFYAQKIQGLDRPQFRLFDAEGIVNVESRLGVRPFKDNHGVLLFRLE